MYGQSSSSSLAHLVNHPCKGQKPNVVAYDFIWDTIIGSSTQAINQIGSKEVWYIDPITNECHSIDSSICKTRGIRVVGIVYITINDIDKDEEVLFDYDYEPSVARKLPWYSKVIN